MTIDGNSYIWQLGTTYFLPSAAVGIDRRSSPMIDVREYPETIAAINAALNSKEIAEIKIEPKGIAVVVVRRTVKSIEKK